VKRFSCFTQSQWVSAFIGLARKQRIHTMIGYRLNS